MTSTLISDGDIDVSSAVAIDESTDESAVDASQPVDSRRLALIVGLTLFFAVAAYYFIGFDEGMTSVFGKTLMVHEWVHDSRHFLGFPCH